MVMALAWSNSKSFKEHVERMRMFRQSHPSDLEVRVALLKSMPTSYILHPVRETGGSGGFIGTGGWPALIPMSKVSLLSQN